MTHLYRSPTCAPAHLDRPSVFLAGSIEMGRAELWQPRVAQTFLDAGAAVFDPRREDWDAGWVQDPTPGSPFETQVSWELSHLARADLVFFRITHDGPAIVSMIEMGLMIGAGRPVVIQADPGYMRYGNIAITARRWQVPLFEEEAPAIACALDRLGLMVSRKR